MVVTTYDRFDNNIMSPETESDLLDAISPFCFVFDLGISSKASFKRFSPHLLFLHRTQKASDGAYPGMKLRKDNSEHLSHPQPVMLLSRASCCRAVCFTWPLSASADFSPLVAPWPWLFINTRPARLLWRLQLRWLCLCFGNPQLSEMKASEVHAHAQSTESLLKNQVQAFAVLRRQLPMMALYLGSSFWLLKPLRYILVCSVCLEKAVCPFD